MGEGPPRSVCGGRSQTAEVLLGLKRLWWWAIWEKALDKGVR